MTNFRQFKHDYAINPEYTTSVAYFSMEFAIHQPLKIYSGGLGFLAGSHMRSAYQLKQNMVGIGILWKNGYYDQARKQDQTMDVRFIEKMYNFLEPTNIKFQIEVNKVQVWVTAYYLAPEVFGTVPMFFLSTLMSENDYLAQSICNSLYDNNNEARIAASILLGSGGAKLLEEISWVPDIYHMNEAHALPLVFHLYNKLGSVEDVRKHVVFTTHTPEEAGNEKTDIHLLDRMSYFNGIPVDKVMDISGIHSKTFDHSLCALRMARISNGVSELHGEVSRQMWNKYDDICPITSITNAQDEEYWWDKELATAFAKKDDKTLSERKNELKRQLFEEVADQTGKVFDENVLTIVWARRYAAYKRPDLIMQDFQRFQQLLNNSKYPVQIIWAGKPYPFDYDAVRIFDKIINVTRSFPNATILTGYELKLSRLMKCGSDVWLNNPRITREASGTSGMTAAMNGSVNFSIMDGWIPEFARDEENCFIVAEADHNWSKSEQDDFDNKNIMDKLEKVIIPMYYDNPKKWLNIVKKGMEDVVPAFSSKRMADEYYKKLFQPKLEKTVKKVSKAAKK